MKAVFADSFYWIAVARPNDPWRQAALDARHKLAEVVLVTTEEVLIEFLTALSKGGPAVRRIAVEMTRAILSDPIVRVEPETHDGFLRGIDRFESREDKQYSMVDCISMNVMEYEGIQDVLTNDHHFEAQQGADCQKTMSQQSAPSFLRAARWGMLLGGFSRKATPVVASVHGGNGLARKAAGISEAYEA